MSQKSKPIRRDGLTVVNPAALATGVPVDTSMPFSPTPPSPAPVSPKTAPRLRQITEGPAVKIVGKVVS